MRILLCLLLLFAGGASAAEPKPLPVLLLGDKGHHNPEAFYKVVSAALAKSGIDVTYTDDVAQITAERLAKYEVLMIFRDSGTLPEAAEKAMMDFVEGGKGIVPVHCASHTFRNSSKYGKLVGGRFQKHETGDFRTRIVDAQHPAMKGVTSFTSWDETYVHNELGDDIRVLMTRDDNGRSEPWTWVREQGKGRMFYTASGHDTRTWKEPGYVQLLASGIRWAAGQVNEPGLQAIEYVEADIPFYVPRAKWGTMGEAIRRMPRPLSPEESMKHMHTPEGFAVSLFASEPQIAKPLAMTWDDRGRLWIAESLDYPNEMQPPGKGRDRIRICEDTDGDGRADKFTVFVDKLSIPTGMAFVPGGLVVVQAPDTLFFAIEPGSDTPKAKKVLFTGWGTSDTHAGPSNLHYRPDGWVWGTCGYSGLKTTVAGKPVAFGQGVFRFRPDGSAVEFIGSTTNNTWGLGFDESGNAFASTANNNHSFHVAVPNRAYEKVRGWFGKGTVPIEDHKTMHPVTGAVRQVDWHGGFTAAAGHAVYTGTGFPAEYRNRAAFVCEPTGHVIHVNHLVKQGSGFVARDGWNLFASTDEWTSPIMAEVGPDGAVWFIDWYNYIVQHNPTPTGFKTGKGNAYETPLRDKTHARIYRITHRDAPKTASVDLSKATPEQLIEALNSETVKVRETAARKLLESQPVEAMPELFKLLADEARPRAAVQAAYLLSQWKGDPRVRHPEKLAAALKSKSPEVVRAVLAILPADAASAKAVVESGVLASADLHVVADAMLRLAEMPGSKATASAIVKAFAAPAVAADKWIPQAATAAAAMSGADFIEAVAAIPADKTIAALGQPVRIVAGHVARLADGASAIRLVTAAGSASPATAEAILQGLSEGWPTGTKVTLTAADAKAIGALIPSLSPAGRSQLVALVNRWGQSAVLGQFADTLKAGLKAVLTSEKSTEVQRLAAAKELIEIAAGEESATLILAQIAPQNAPSLTRGLLDALGDSTADAVGAALVKRWPELTPAVRKQTLPLLLRRVAWTVSLLDGIDKGVIDRSDLSAEEAQRLSKHPTATVAERASKLLAGGGRLPDADRQKVIDQFMPVARIEGGDPIKGRVVFEANCSKCHKHGSLGNSIGPDLTGMAVREKADLLMEILDPNRSVEGNYRQYIARTLKGTIVSGLLVAENQTAIEMLDSENKRHVILREDIDELISSKLSLMPEGFEKIASGDLTNLLTFLTQRDKYVPLALGKAASVSTVKGMFISKDGDVERLIFPKWGPVSFDGVTFQVVDPRDGSIPNAILLHSTSSPLVAAMPKTATVACNSPAKAIHMLSGVGGWAFPYGKKGELTMTVRLHYADKSFEDHPLYNGIHFADYIRVVDVPGSKLAFNLRGQQIRYLKLEPKKGDKIDRIEFVKGTDTVAPIVMAITIETK